MKFLDKLALKLFSLIMIVEVICIILFLVGFIPVDALTDGITKYSDFGEDVLHIVIAVLAVVTILALKGLFFTSKTEDNSKAGIVLENGSGKLVISRESLENLIASVTREIPGAETVSSKTIVDKNRNLIVSVTIVVNRDVMLKDVSTQLQDKVKEAMKQTADLEVKEVNVRIKNISSRRTKNLPKVEDKKDINPEGNTNEETNNSDESNSSGEE